VPTEELPDRQAVKPITSVDDLAADVEPFESGEEYGLPRRPLRLPARRARVSLIVVDTHVASTLLRPRTSDALPRQLAGHTVAITFVTYGELTKWTLVRRWGPRTPDTMRTFLAALVVLPYEQRVATRWGEMQPTCGAGRPPLTQVEA
jgi:hypothetical protein